MQFLEAKPVSKYVFPAILLVVVSTAIGLQYGRALDIGFLLDDFQHVDYVARAYSGDADDLIHVLTRNWSGRTDAMTSFRPLISLSFCLDYMLCGANGFGYHLSNLIMCGLASVLVGLITSELARGAKPLWSICAAGFASLLFVLYPIHPEAVAWVIGRVDVQCTMFYLLSIYAFIKYRAGSGAIAWLILSLSAFVCSLASKEMAVTLPLVIVALEFFLAGELAWRVLSTKEKLRLLACFFIALFLFAVWRACSIGTVVGGYGSGDLKEFLRAFRNFLDPSSFRKALYGINEEVPFDKMLVSIAEYAWMLIGAVAVYRFVSSSRHRKIIAFALFWVIVAQLPTFQIWHIYPNLVGSRLFFLGSAPLSMLVALLIVEINHSKVDSKADSSTKDVNAGKSPVVYLVRAISILAVSSLVYCFVPAMSHNLDIWVDAGKQMSTMRQDIEKYLASLEPSQCILLADLPQDFRGAGLVGRPEFLSMMMRPPLAKEDYRARVLTLRYLSPSARDYLYPGLLLSLARDPEIERIYRWETSTGRYIPWQPLAHFDDNSPLDIIPELLPSKPASTEMLHFRLSDGDSFSPFALSWLAVSAKFPDSDSVDPGKTAGIYWRSQKHDIDKSQTSPSRVSLDLLSESNLFFVTAEKAASVSTKSDSDSVKKIESASWRLAILERNAAWHLQEQISEISTDLDIYIDSHEILDNRLIDLRYGVSSTLAPRLWLSGENAAPSPERIARKDLRAQGFTFCLSNPLAIDLSQTRIDKARVYFDYSSIVRAKSLSILVSRPGVVFPVAPELDFGARADFKNIVAEEIRIPLDSPSGFLPLATILTAAKSSESIIPGRIFQISAIARDESGRQCGIVSEPLAFCLSGQ